MKGGGTGTKGGVWRTKEKSPMAIAGVSRWKGGEMVAFTAQFPSGDAISCLHGDGCHRTAGALWQGGHRRSSPAAFCGRVCVILLEHVCAFRGKGMRNWRLHVGVGDTAVSVSVQDARLENRSVLPAQNAAQMQITHLRSHLQLLLILFPLFVTHCTPHTAEMKHWFPGKGQKAHCIGSKITLINVNPYICKVPQLFIRVITSGLPIPCPEKRRNGNPRPQPVARRAIVVPPYSDPVIFNIKILLRQLSFLEECKQFYDVLPMLYLLGLSLRFGS